MSLVRLLVEQTAQRFPRSRGDEPPISNRRHRRLEFSPLTRG